MITDLRQYLGSMLICGFDGVNLPDKFQQLLSDGHISGVILFARNYTNRIGLKNLTGSAQRCSLRLPIIAVDQEGGRVVRFSGDFPTYPSPHYYQQQYDAEGLLEATQRTAEYLKNLGVNLNLVPVCDLAPSDPSHVIHSRSYSGDPQELAQIVSRQVTCMRETGILSCAKHFPGLVSAHGDPHLQVSRSDQILSDFRAKDYLSFQAAIGAGADMVMVTHLFAPAIDPDNIATFSSIAINRELRDYLHYDGLVISDDLLMAGAVAGSTPSEAGIKAILAGCDLLVYGNLLENVDQVIDEICTAAASDAKLGRRLAESHERVTDFKQRRLSSSLHESSVT